MKGILKPWWLVLLKGIILVLLAFYVFSHPVDALVGLALYIGISLLITGFLLIFNALSIKQSESQWGWTLAEGIVDVIFALILLTNPAITASVLPFVVGFWMIFYGIMIFAGSFGAKNQGYSNWWINLIGGILTVFIGYAIMTDTMTGAIAITFWMASGFLLFGIINIFIGLNMKQALNKLK